MANLSRDHTLLSNIQSRAAAFFVHETNHDNGLVRDKNAPGWPASIAATGLALSCYPIAIERGKMSHKRALERTLNTLRFFDRSAQGEQHDATGYRGFYYHFLDMDTGKRAWDCELSSVDTAFLMGGMLAAAAYFQADTPDEREVRELVERLYNRVEWDWLHDGTGRIRHGWKPESGFIPFHWEGYDESLLLHVLALGSPTHPVPPMAYTAWSSTFSWKQCYGVDFLYSAPLFTHQLSHVWLDMRDIQDDFMREHRTNFFENTARATDVQRRYAIDNPAGFKGYDEDNWGVTASDGPGPATLVIDGIERRFYDYEGRGAPFGLDDGTLSPWAVVASLPFAPDVVLTTLHHYVHKLNLHDCHQYGFRASFNPTFDGVPGSAHGWKSKWHFGINLGPIVAMIENHETDFLWKLMRSVPSVVNGLKLAGFRSGWLDRTEATA